MADLNLSVEGLFEKAFGTGRGFDGNQLRTDEQPKKEFDVPADESGEGTEFLSVRNELNAKLPDGRSIFMPVQLGGVLLPNEPTISFAVKKRVVQTDLVGSKRKGTVKELINSEDWQVTIRGVAINFDSKDFYPEDIVKSLNELSNREEALEIRCALTSLLGIYRLVIVNFRLLEMVGVQHAQAYEFRCVSDEDFILEID